MRYELGQTYVFLHAPNVDMSAALPKVRHAGVAPSALLLTCKEHHRVPLSMGNRTKVDGYVFETPEGERWFNHYPRPFVDDHVNEGNHIVLQPDMEPQMVYEDATSYLARLMTGIELLQQRQSNRWDAFCEHYSDCVRVLTELDYAVESEPLRIIHVDGTQTLFPSLFTVRLRRRLTETLKD